MGALMQAHDWSRSPVGNPSSWPQSLRSVAGLMLANRHMMFVAWGAELAFLYNDGFAPVLGKKHPWALGRPFREVWPEIWDDIEPLVKTALSGDATWSENLHLVMECNGYPEDCWYTFSYSPVRDESGTVSGLFCACSETTSQVLATRRQAFLLELSDTLHPLTDAHAMQAEACRLLGTHLGVAQVGFAEIQADQRHIIAYRDWNDGRIASVAGTWQMDDFGPQCIRQMKAGETIVIPDVRLDARTSAPEVLDVYASIGTRAVLDVPLVRDGHLAALLFIHHPEPRAWTADDLVLVEDACSRLWAAVERARAEDALRAAEEKHRAIFAGTSALLLILAPDAPRFTITDANEAYCRATMTSRDAIIGRALFEVFPENPEDVTATNVSDLRTSLLRALASGQTDVMGRIKYDIPKPGGGFEERWWDPTNSPLLGPDGKVMALVHHASERTDVELAMRALRASEERQRFILGLGDCFSELSDAREIASAAVEALGLRLGVSRVGFGEISADGQSISFVSVHVNGIARLPGDTFPISNFGRGVFEELRRGLTAAAADLAADPRTSDADWASMQARAAIAVPLIRDGRFRAILYLTHTSVRDWTSDEVSLVEEVAARTWEALERARAEAELRALNETLEAKVAESSADLDRVWRNASDMFVVIDGEDGVFRRANPAVKTILGWTEAELIGRPVFDLIHPDDVAGSLAALERTRSEALPAYENRYRTRDGQYRSIAWVAAPEGRVVYCYGRDVTAARQAATELEQAQEALRQSQKMEAMGQLTGGVAHDFNNLLTPIMGALDMLQRKGLGGEREQRLIAGAMQSADRATTLVQRLLSFARRQPLQSVPVDIGKLVIGMADLVASTTGPQIKVVVELPDDLAPAMADANQLEMALLNLGVNARDAMPEGGTLRITADTVKIGAGHRSRLRPGDYICLSVADTGEGMDEATLARAIEPFFSTKGVGKGTGLGLSMVHGLALQLGGALTIQSRPQVGTNVEFWLPATTAVPGITEVTPEQVAASPARGTALLVDDEPLILISTADMLNDLGYGVIEAASGEEAMRLVDAGKRFDLLVTDHLMPGMTGIELIRMVRERLPALPVLVVSGYAEGQGIAVDIPRLTKPFRKDDLAARLQTILP